MTVSTNQIRVSYNGDGVTVNFPIPFPFYLGTDLLVLLNGVILNSGYSVSGGNGGTGTLLMATPPTATPPQVLLIILNVPLTQLADLVDGTAFPSATINQVNDRAIQAALRLQDQVNRSLRAPDGDITPGMLLPAAATRASKYLAFDANGNILPTAALPGTANTPASLGPIFNPQSGAEIAAGVLPTNYIYAPGYPERYGTNAIPGTTSMTAALQAAINVVKKGGAGGVVSVGSSGPYFIDGALDLTTPVGSTYSGFTVRGVGNSNPAASSPSAVISLMHNAIAFDCTGSLGITFENLTIQAFNATYPTIGFLLARNADATSQTMRFNNVQVLGNFSKALVYNFGAEDDQYTACSFYNRATDANSCTMYFTSKNILGITSTFTTIAPSTPAQSTIDHKIIGGEIAHQGGQNTNDVIRLDAVSNVKILFPWMLCASGSASGRSLIYMHTVNGSTNLVTLLGVEGESATFVGNYGIFFDGVAGAIPSYWVIESCTMPNVTSAIVSNTNVTCDDFHVKALSNQGLGGGISIAKLQNSHIDELGLSGVAIQIGTSQNNIYNCNAANVAITTDLGGDYWACVGLGTWTPITSALTHGGTLSFTHPNYQRQGSEITVTVTLNDTVSLSCAAGTLLGGLPITAIAFGTVIVTNQSVPSLIGAGSLSGTSIVLPAISVGAGVNVTITARYFTN